MYSSELFYLKNHGNQRCHFSNKVSNQSSHVTFSADTHP